MRKRTTQSTDESGLQIVEFDLLRGCIDFVSETFEDENGSYVSRKTTQTTQFCDDKQTCDLVGFHQDEVSCVIEVTTTGRTIYLDSVSPSFKVK